MDSEYWTRNAKRYSRRSVLRSGALGTAGVALALAGVGCSEDEPEESDASGTQAPAGAATMGSTAAATSAGDHPRGGEIRYGMDRDPVSFDPHIEASYRTQWTGAGYAYNKVLRLTSDLQIEPDLATGYEATDDTEVVFKLNEGVKFHDIAPVNGRVLTSEDVKYSLERIVTPQPEFQRAYMFEAISSIETPDDTTVVIRTAQPFAPLFTYLANSFSVIVAPEAVEQFGDLRQNIIGTGPFQYAEHTQESNYQFKRFDGYFAKERPYLDSVRADIIPDSSSRISAMLARELSIEGVSGEDAEQFRNNDAWEVQSSSQGGQTNLRFNCTKPPFDDVRVRKAFDLAVNKLELIGLVLGGHGSLSGPVGPGLGDTWAIPAADLAGRPGYREDKEEDYAEARKLLDAAGIGEFAPEFIYYTPAVEHETNAVAVDQQMRNAGINVTPELVKLDYAAWIPRMLEHDFAVTVTGSGFRDNPDEYLYALFATDASRNDTGYSNPDMDELLNRQRTLLDEEERSALVQEINLKLLEEVPNSWLYAETTFEVVDSKFKNYQITYSHNRANKFEYVWMES